MLGEFKKANIISHLRELLAKKRSETQQLNVKNRDKSNTSCLATTQMI